MIFKMCKSNLFQFKNMFLYLISILIGCGAHEPVNSKDVPTLSSISQDKSNTSTFTGHLNNILLIICDQEEFELLSADNYTLPGRGKLHNKGTTFENHYIASAMCTPSRGAIFTGTPPQVNGIFDQMQLGYVPSMRTDEPSMGTIMKGLGYTTAYYGKFELDKELLNTTDKTNYTTALQPYGFDYFEPDGDKWGKPSQGYDTDNYTYNEGVRWLRTYASKLEKEGKPWFMVMSGINPHDIMYGDANLPGQEVQKSKVGATITPPPKNEIYQKQWNFNLWPSLNEPIDSPTRPNAQLEYHIGWSDVFGYIPNDRTDMWNVFYNYYLNLLRDSDRDIQELLDTLDNLNLWKNTVVILTSDHGELGGSHGGLRGKGPFPYEQNAHVPMVIVHPDHEGGRTCKALTSHIDLIPTLVGLTNSSEEVFKNATEGLPGHNFAHLLNSPEKAPLDAIRPGVLFNYVGLQTIDANYLTYETKKIMEGRWPPPLDKKHPDLNKRGFLSFVYDGRYKYARYYAPSQFNTPKTLEEILNYNDIELFDLKNDPEEVNNLAVDTEANKELILRMNSMLNELMSREVGKNDWQFLPKAVRPKGPVTFDDEHK